MSLRIVVGPMFAGKTSEIQSVVRRYGCLGKKVLILTADIDTRYKRDSVVNHDQNAIPAHGVDIRGLMEVLTWSDFTDATAVVVDEAQFFVDCLIPFLCAEVDQYGKHVVVVGLDSDAERRPFGDVLTLATQADSIEKKTALCRRCGDGTAAIFTKALAAPVPRMQALAAPVPRMQALAAPVPRMQALAAKSEQVAVGGADMYEPVCRRHFLEVSE